MRPLFLLLAPSLLVSCYPYSASPCASISARLFPAWPTATARLRQSADVRRRTTALRR